MWFSESKVNVLVGHLSLLMVRAKSEKLICDFFCVSSIVLPRCLLVLYKCTEWKLWSFPIIIKTENSHELDVGATKLISFKNLT